jgi:hypothetical protein
MSIYLDDDDHEIILNDNQKDTAHQEKYAYNYRFNSKNGASIIIDITEQDHIYFMAFDSNQTLNSYGQLVVDTSARYENGFGELQDSTFLLVPNGEWFFSLEENKLAYVHFDEGKRQGISQIRINTPDGQMVLSETFYIQDAAICMSKENHGTIKELTPRLFGKWYHLNSYTNGLSLLYGYRE